MSSRGITLLGLIQLFAVLGIIAAARISLRLAETQQAMLGSHFQLPPLLRLTQDYSVALLLIPLLWTLGSVWLNRTRYSSLGGINLSGTSGLVFSLGLLYLLLWTATVLFR